MKIEKFEPCEGYEIISACINHGGEAVVIGYDKSKYMPYVCWFTANGRDYYFGVYTGDYESAKRTFCERILYENGYNHTVYVTDEKNLFRSGEFSFITKKEEEIFLFSVRNKENVTETGMIKANDPEDAEYRLSELFKDAVSCVILPTQEALYYPDSKNYGDVIVFSEN